MSQLLESEKRRSFRHRNHKRNHLQILDGVMATHYHSLENTWELLVKTWVPPPAWILDATAGPMWMWRNILDARLKLDEGTLQHEGYILTFTDIEPQRNGVEKCALADLDGYFGSDTFNAVVLDPPYRRNLEGSPYDIKRFRGAQGFELLQFIKDTNRVIPRILKDNGKLILKIGDARMNGQFEPWDLIATAQLTNFKIEDRVIRRPFYFRKRVMGAKGRATLIHETFLLYSLRPTSGSVQPTGHGGCC